MDHADFPWQHLGTLLVEEGLVARSDLDSALAEQRRTGRLLGQILVQQGVMSGTALARALARQHGVELRQANGAVAEQVVGLGEAPASEAPTRWDRPWKPLGKLLVENGVISPGALLDALVEKGDHPDRRLGEILVRHGHVSGAELASALADQHGLNKDGDDANRPGAGGRLFAMPPPTKEPEQPEPKPPREPPKIWAGLVGRSRSPAPSNSIFQQRTSEAGLPEYGFEP